MIANFYICTSKKEVIGIIYFFKYIFMRKFTYLLTMLALALGFSVARADVVTPYAYDFSGLGSGKLVSSFAPPGWAHYVDRFQADSWSTPSFVEYFAQETGGYGDDGACLKVGSQTLYDSWGESSQTMTDMIVTPAITGDASIYVKQSAAEGSVSFYTCTVASDGTVTKGDKYEVTVPALSTDAWTKVELPNVAAGTRLGICGDQVLLDEFSAASADVVLKRGMTILSSPTMISSGDLCADADGNVQVQFKAKIKNSGEVPLAVGDEGYTVSLYDNSDGVAVGEPVPVSFPLAVGESQYLEGTVTMAVTKNYRHGFHLKENISGVTTYLGWIEVFPHAPVFTLEDNLSHDVENGSTVDFQVMQASTSKVFVISNAKGGAPLTINSVSVPEGFSYKISATENGEAATFPYEVAALGKAYLTVTMDASMVGKRSGNIVITPADGQGEVYTLAVTGEIVDPSKVYINFNDQKFPAGTYIELSSGQKQWKVSNFYYGENGYAATSDEVELSKFVLPKIRLAEGEHMTFDANKRNATTSKLNVYYSADRKNWTQVKNITIDNSDDANCFAMGTYPGGYYDNFMYKTFSLDNIPAGDWYIAFEAGYARVDNIIGGSYLDTPDYEAELGNVKIPETAMVNHASTVSFDVASFGKKDIEEGVCTAKFYIGEDLIAEKALPAIASGEYASVEFQFTPRKNGEFAAKLVVDGGVQIERTATITVAAEEVVGEAVVGNCTTTANDTPLQLNYYHSQSEIIYPADLLNIPAGTELKSIAFLGYKNAYSNKEISSDLKIWMENTDATSPKQDEWYQSESMTQVYADTYAVAAVIGSSSDHQPIIKVTFNTPFTYTGGNLRVTVMSSAEQYSSTNFEVDGDHAALAAIRYADGTLSGTMTLRPLPVTVFGFDKEASVFSGVVTSAADNAVVEGAEVKLVSDNVEYSGTTDAEGKFNFIVVQDGLEYNLTVSKEGFFADREKVNMGGTSFVKNVALNVAQGFNVLSADIPENAEVNSVYKVVARVENGEAKEAGSYRAELWMGDGVVATAETPALEASKEYDFEFSVIPHAVGAAETFVKFTAETGTAASETVNVTVNKEKGNAEVLVGTPTTTATAGPADFFYKYSKTEIIYPKSLINLPAGTKINEIQFFGTHSSKNITFSVDAWIGNVAEGTALMGESTEGLTQVADKMTVDHSEAVTAENIKSVVTLTFPDGFVYDGGDIRLFLTSAGTAYNSTSFEVDENVKGQAQQAKKDDETQMATASFSDISLPVAHFIVSPYKTLSGAVKNEKGEAVASAYIILASADGVEYYSETDAEGAFSMDVIKYGKEYTLTVSHPSYDAYTHPETISLADGNVSGLAVTLTKTYTYSGVVTDAETHAPIAGVEIYVSNPESGADVMTGTTDENGAFDLKFKQLGTYNVLFKAAGYDMVSYEGTPFEGDMVGKAVEMQKTVYTFSGVVTDAETKAPIKGVEVYVSDPESGADVMTGTTDENGAFALKFKQLGTYNVLFKATGYDMVSSEEVPFEGNFDITVEMQKTVRTFSGTVTDAESHAAIAGASVALYKGENKVAEATTGADGSFEIKVKDLAVFSLVVKAEGYEDFTFDTIDLTEGDMTDTPIEMTPNSGVGMLTADGLRVYGTVGAVVVESATEATVRVYNAAGSLVRRADVAGKTRIEGLQRGVYIVNGVKVIVK